MALNLIKVTQRNGGAPMWIGVSQIVAVVSETDGCMIYFSSDKDRQGTAVREQASVVAELCNRRPPDGN